MRLMNETQLWQIVSGWDMRAPKPTEEIWLEALRRGTLRKKNRSRISSEQVDGLQRTIRRVLRSELPGLDEATIDEARRLEERITSLPMSERWRWSGFCPVDLGEQKPALEWHLGANCPRHGQKGE